MTPSSPARSPVPRPSARRKTLPLQAALALVLAVQLVSLGVSLVDPRWFFPGLERYLPTLIACELLALVATVHTLYRVVLVARYRPAPDVDDSQLPSLTVVVPAYNEGRQVLSTLRSLAASRYPVDRLQLIAVDDGSDDDTWQWIRHAERELGEKVTAVRCEKNGGKRQALYEGFRRARGEIVITVDSDSEVLPDTLRRMVAPFLIEPECGAVAGNVRVLNRHEGALPKMLDAAFTAAFDFMRAGESVAGGVMTCPGALSAFRLALLTPVLQEWLDQTFFGRPAGIGEDRALTNLILRGGYTVRYQGDAIVLTQVPSTARGLCKMFVRWGRSNVRESAVLGMFLFGSRTVSGRSRRGLEFLFAWSVISMLLAAALFLPSLAFMATQPVALALFLGLALLGSLQTWAVAAAARGSKIAFWALPWGLYSMVVTGWITPWSLVTAHRSGWLTRGPAKGAAPAPVVRLPTRTVPAPSVELPRRATGT